jgi:hypothetical protein
MSLSLFPTLILSFYVSLSHSCLTFSLLLALSLSFSLSVCLSFFHLTHHDPSLSTFLSLHLHFHRFSRFCSTDNACAPFHALFFIFFDLVRVVVVDVVVDDDVVVVVDDDDVVVVVVVAVRGFRKKAKKAKI